ncbi:glycosyltransferase family 4 protein [Dyella sp. A6]|uniref:glycosyltransferase family 4 protein n=1 Tax=Dyella aluminiiresistens TaxID=3069105 RepID=UPI002E780563|nr:glycosyltransferase family 4 protein [Dyella sp. A6]
MNASPVAGVVAGGVAAPADTSPHAPSAGGAPAPARPIRLLVFTTLYPDAERPRHGIFVEERLRHLVASGRIEATVVAPVPWFPLRHRHFGAYATFARVPAQELRHGIRVLHPRYPVIPKVGMNIAPGLMYRSLLPLLRRLATEGSGFDLIDAHYFYPDGVAAARLGEVLGKPVVITARGSDVNVIAHYPLPARQIRWAAERAGAIVTVSEALKSKVGAMGVQAGKVVTLRNGVDTDRFRPLERADIRARLDLAGPVWLAVGNLVELKGVHITLAALARANDATLLIVGDGPERARLQGQVRQLGLDARVRFLGTIAQAQLVDFYNAADVLVLASSREGMPNVVLESLACGTPVVAAPFDGVSELLTAPEAGEIAAERSAEAIAAACCRLQERAPARAATRAFAQQLGWRPVVKAQCALYAKVLAEDGRKGLGG